MPFAPYNAFSADPPKVPRPWALDTYFMVCTAELIFISVSGFSTPQSLKDIVKLLEEKVGPDEFDMPVRREFTLEDALQACERKAFSPSKKIVVNLNNTSSLVLGISLDYYAETCRVYT